MVTYHRFDYTATSAGLVYECREGCGRRIVVDLAGALTMIDRGDPLALHRGGSGDVEFDQPSVAPGVR